MPFERKTVEMEREDFVKEAMAKSASFAALCRKYGISRPTGYLWQERFQNGEGLSDKSHMPFRTPNKTSSELEAEIVAARTREPAVGAVKIRRMLENKGIVDVPCASTINAILKRRGMVTPETSQAATAYQRFEKEQPNMMWQCDFKGHYLLADGSRCHPLSVIDDHSRFCLCADAKTNERYEGTKESFERTFREYGLPKVLLCDNGNPWGNSQTTGYTRFEFGLMDLGILTMHIRAKRPQTQGKVEAFNGSFKKERLKFYTPTDMEDAHKQRLEYREFYNNERPHHALALETPASRYRASQTPYPDKISDWDYGEAHTRKIKGTGFLTLSGQGYFLGEAVAGRTIAVQTAATDGFVNILYRQFRIARISLKERAVVSRRIYLLHDDPRNV